MRTHKVMGSLAGAADSLFDAEILLHKLKNILESVTSVHRTDFNVLKQLQSLLYKARRCDYEFDDTNLDV